MHKTWIVNSFYGFIALVRERGNLVWYLYDVLIKFIREPASAKKTHKTAKKLQKNTKKHTQVCIKAEKTANTYLSFMISVSVAVTVNYSVTCISYYMYAVGDAVKWKQLLRFNVFPI